MMTSAFPHQSPELRSEWLRLFVGLVQTGNFREAAQRYDVSAQVFKDTLKRLEKQLNTQLVVANDSDLVLTQVGQAFFTRSERLLHSLDSLEHRLKALDGQSCEQIPGRVGHLGLCSMAYLGEAVQALPKNLQVQPWQMQRIRPEAVERDLLLNRVDLVVVSDYPSMLPFQFFLQNNIQLVCTEGKKSPGCIVSVPGKTRPWEAYDYVDWSYELAPGEPVSLWNDLLYPRRIRTRTNSIDYAMTLCQRESYACLVPESVLHDYPSLSQGSLISVARPPEQVWFQNMLFWRRDRPQVPHVIALREALLEMMS